MKPPSLPSFPGFPLGTSKTLLDLSLLGKGTSRLLGMGESLGEHEEKERRPFVEWAEAGSVLERALRIAGVSREALTLSNLVWYRPPQNRLLGEPWEMEAIRACAPFNEALVEEVQPRAILALGGLPFRELTGFAGEKQSITLCRGFVVPGLWFPGIPVVGTYHPSGLRRASKEKQKGGPKLKTEAAGGGTQGMALLGVLVRDILLALKVAREGAPSFKHAPYILGGTLDDWENFYQEASLHPELPISYDWEWPRSARTLSEEEIEAGEHERNIIQGQMALPLKPEDPTSWKVVVSPFNSDLLPIWKKILALPNPKLDWNGRKADRPLASEYGLVLAGPLHDGMDFWHHAQPDLPRGLQYATSFFCPEVGPWKHFIGTDPLFYGALDVDMPLRVFFGIQKTLRGEREPHSGLSLLDGYRMQVLELSPALDAMSRRGIPVSEPKRLGLSDEFAQVQAEINEKMQALAPEEIRNVEPKEGFKRKQKLPSVCLEAAGQVSLFPSAPKGSSGRGGDISSTEGSTDSPRVGTTVALGLGKFGEEASASRVVDPSSGNVYVVRSFRDSKTKEEVKRWARLLPFKPSSDQVLRYMRWQGWEIQRHPKTDSETADELAIRKTLSAHPGDPLLPLVLDYREVGVAKETFVEAWKPAPDGAVHSFFGFKPASGQLSSEHPNAQNFPKHSAAARKMNRMLEARPGRRFVRFDWKSFHVLTLGFEAEDPLYMRMARLDMHSFFALVGLLKLEPPEKVLELPDPELSSLLSWWRKQPRIFTSYSCSGHPGGMTFGEIRDERAKRTILGVGFGQSGLGMYKRNPESFASSKEASECLLMLNRVFPRPQRWREAVTAEADAHHKLLTRHGFQRWFWDVFERRRLGPSQEPRRGQRVLEDGKGNRFVLAPGDDHEACIAYRPANDAFGIKRLVMVGLERDGLAERWGLCNEIHDDLDFECPEEYVDECLEEGRKRMEAPSLYLRNSLVPGGLSCKVEAKVGRNLDFKDSENPAGLESVKLT